MKRFIPIFLFLLAPIALLAHTKVTNMKEMLPHFQTADRSTLAIFDVDGVLVQPADPAFQLPNWIKHKAIAKEATVCFTPDQMMLFIVLMVTRCDSQLIDPDVHHIFDHLRTHRVPTIALTACMTGAIADIPSLEEWRLEHLNKHGLHFADITPHKHPITFHDLPPYRGNYPVHRDGVVFTNDNGKVPTKGETLLAYLEETGQTPSKIIFIDDRLHYLEQVETSLSAYHPNIEFVGLHYTGAKNFPSKPISAEEFRLKWDFLRHLTLEHSDEHS